MNHSSPPASLMALVRRHLRYLPDDQELGPGDSLTALGLDSLSSIGLLLDIERDLAVVVADEHLVPATFETAAALWSVIGDQCANDGLASPGAA